jgi:CRISPR/Cas system CSM-associated protein Csm3 (group 7 of RAMP superfamily)
MQPERSLDLIPLADNPFVHTFEELQQLAPHKVAEADKEHDVAKKRQILLSGLARSQITDAEIKEWNEQRQVYTKLLDPKEFSANIFKYLSSASQLFGCTLHAGLVRLDDAHASQENSHRRVHVAIDRFTGSVGTPPFQEELAPAHAPLTTKLTITNFALWQIGLLALVFQEINLGYVGIGGGTRKGQGQVKIEVPSVTCTYNAKAWQQNGIISAQARLAEEPWNCSDIPLSVQATEGPLPDQQGKYLCLLRDLVAQSDDNDWRCDGMKRFVLSQEQVHELFKDAVQKAWKPWIKRIREETDI